MGWSAGGVLLVHCVLLPGQAGVQQGPPIYVLDPSHVSHALPPCSPQLLVITKRSQTFCGGYSALKGQCCYKPARLGFVLGGSRFRLQVLVGTASNACVSDGAHQRDPVPRQQRSSRITGVWLSPVSATKEPNESGTHPQSRSMPLVSGLAVPLRSLLLPWLCTGRQPRACCLGLNLPFEERTLAQSHVC